VHALPRNTQFTIVGTIERLREFVDRCDSPWVTIIFDPVNHMRYDRVYNSGVDEERSGDARRPHRRFHVKDVAVDETKLLYRTSMRPRGSGRAGPRGDHTGVGHARTLETFSLEHFSDPTMDQEASAASVQPHPESGEQHRPPLDRSGCNTGEMEAMQGR